MIWIEAIGPASARCMIVQASHGGATALVRLGPADDPWAAASQAVRMLLPPKPDPETEAALRRLSRPAATMLIRPLEEDDLPAVLEITNHYIVHTAINFHLEPITPAGMADHARPLPVVRRVGGLAGGHGRRLREGE